VEYSFVDGVAHALTEGPAGSRVIVLGITNRSFAQPYILLSAGIADNPGYFGERLAAARTESSEPGVEAENRPSRSHVPRTDILGALDLASQIFAQEPGATRRQLIVFSDMR